MRKPRNKSKTKAEIDLRKKEVFYLFQLNSLIRNIDRKSQFKFAFEHVKKSINNENNEKTFDEIYDYFYKLEPWDQDIYYVFFNNLHIFYDEIIDKNIKKKIGNQRYIKWRKKFVYIIFDSLQLTQFLPRAFKHEVEIIWNDTNVDEVKVLYNWDFDEDYRGKFSAFFKQEF